MDEVLAGIIGVIIGMILGASIIVDVATNGIQRDCGIMQQFRIGDAVYRCEKQP